MSAPQDLTQAMLVLLDQMTQPDTAVVVSATSQLNKLMKRPESIASLLEILHTAPSETLRQIAAVMMRQRIAKHWGNLAQATRDAVQATLLQHVAYEPSSLVRRSVAEVVGTVARITLPVGGWPALMPFLQQCAQSPDAEHREAALKLFAVVAPTVLSDRRNRAAKPLFFQLAGEALANPANPFAVKVAALQAVGGVVLFFDCERDVVAFRDGLLPHMLELVRHCIAAQLVDPIVAAFECFEDLMELTIKAAGSCIPPIAQISLEVAANSSLDFPIRQIAFTFVEWVARCKPGFVKKRGLVLPILTVLFRMCAEHTDDEEVDSAPCYGDGEGEDNDEPTPHMYAAEMIDMLSESLPSRIVYNTATPLIGECLRSEDPWQKRAGLAALAVLAENCAEAMKPHLSEIVLGVLGLFEHPARVVKETACIAMGQLSEHLLPEILEFHAQVIPTVFRSMADPDPVFKRKGCNVFEVFGSSLGERIVPYVPQLMERLLDLVVSAPHDVKEIAIGCIASVVESAGREFAPFMQATLSVLKPLSALASEQEMLIRGRAIECFGAIAKVVGKEAFAPFVVEAMTNAVQGLQIESAFVFDVREMIFGFFAVMAQVLGPDFGPFLEGIMPLVFAMVESTELSATGEDTVVNGEPEEDSELPEEEDLGDEEDDDDDDADDADVRTHLAFFQAKAAACRAVGTIAKETKSLFFPYIEKAATSLLSNALYPFTEVRASVLFAVPQLFDVVVATPSLQVPQGLHPSTKALVEETFKVALSAVDQERSLVVVVNALDAVSHTCMVLGEVAVSPFFEEITRRLTMILERKTLVQMSASNSEELEDEAQEEEELDDGPSEDRELELVEAVCEVMIELAKIYGKRIEPFFVSVLAHLARLMRQDNGHLYRALGMAVIVEVVRIAKIDPTPFLDGAMQLIAQGLQDEDAKVRHNSSFCAGILLANAGQNGLRFHAMVATKLAPLLQLPTGTDSIVRDNAVGAVGRLLLVPGTPLPLDQVLPVWFAALPLQVDEEEYEPVLDFIAALLQTQQLATLTPHLPAMVAAFAHAVTWAAGSKPEVDASIAKVAALFKQLLSQQPSGPSSLRQLFSSLPSEQQAALSRVL